jgi:hypothetical protein
MVFDHLKLVRRDVREVAKFRTFLLSVQAGEVMHAAVEHESDNSCCRREDWRQTERSLIKAMMPRRTAPRWPGRSP